MFERYTKKLQKAIWVARSTVGFKRAAEMDPEHLLAAVLYVAPDCVGQDHAWAILQQLGYLEVLDRSLTNPGAYVSFSARTRQCLSGAVARADALGHRWVRAEHLLVTVAAESDTDAARALSAHADVGALEASALSRGPGDGEPFDSGPRLSVVPGRIGTPRSDAV